MTGGSQIGRRSAVGLVSTLAWLSLFIAVASTAASLTVSSLNHVGTSASMLVKDISEKPSTINSIIDEFKKNADPKTVAEIEKNRAKITSTISSLGSSEEFQDLLSSTLNQISQAILNGSNSVKVDFSKIASLVANKVNETSKSTVISQKELAKIKPQTLDLSKQSQAVVNVRNRIKEVMSAWILWLILLAVLYLLIGWRVLRTAGWHLFTIGTVFLLVRFGAPVVMEKILSNSTWPTYQRELVPRVFNSLTESIVTLSTVLALVGFSIVILERLLRERIRPKESQMRPSVVA